MIYRPLTLLSIIVILLLIQLGCNGKTYISTEFVEGTVTLDGVPLDDVIVTFLPVNSGELGYASTDAEGKFKVSTFNGKSGTGTTVGEYRVTFNKEIEDVTKRHFRKDETGKDIPLPNLETIQIVPKKYLSPETSGFTVTVEKGKNVFNFDLVSE
jgi:hypothetical protein